MTGILRKRTTSKINGAVKTRANSFVILSAMKNLILIFVSDLSALRARSFCENVLSSQNIFYKASLRSHTSFRMTGGVKKKLPPRLFGAAAIFY